MPGVSLSAAARRDLIEQFVYLAEAATSEVAERFLDQAQATFETLAKQPEMGAPLTLKRTELAGLRKWRVTDFDNHLIFYKPRLESVLIVRVLHAARNWWGILGLER